VVVIVGAPLATFDLVPLADCCWLVDCCCVVSLALLWPKLAASLLVISATAPLSAEVDLTVTNLTRARLFAVGVDLITLLSTRCCSAEMASTKARAITRYNTNLILANNDNFSSSKS